MKARIIRRSVLNWKPLNSRGNALGCVAKQKRRLGSLLVISCIVIAHLSACGSVSEVPDFDNLIGMHFEDAMQGGATWFEAKSISENLIEYSWSRQDECIFIYGVEKETQIIRYWRVEPSPEQCRVLKHPINM